MSASRSFFIGLLACPIPYRCKSVDYRLEMSLSILISDPLGYCISSFELNKPPLVKQRSLVVRKSSASGHTNSGWITFSVGHFTGN